MDFMLFLEQMGTSNIALVAAFFIGLMTAISPCPLVTNMTAIAYISKKIDSNKHTFLVCCMLLAEHLHMPRSPV